MQRHSVLVIGLAFVANLQAKHHFFHSATLLSSEECGATQEYVIDSPLGIFTVRHNRTVLHSSPRFSLGPITISIESQARPGDETYLLDSNDREYRATILVRNDRPPPPPVP
jgi:hypothetical protein